MKDIQKLPIDYIRVTLFFLAVSALLLSYTGNLLAEPQEQYASERNKKLLEDLVNGKIKLPKENQPGPVDEEKKRYQRPPEAPPNFVQDKLTYDKYLLSLQEYFEYNITSLQHRQKVFDWQLFSAKLIFIIVLVLVASGVYFAAVQFHVELRYKKQNKDAGTQLKTEFSAGADGIKVSSGVLGVIILSLSLAFFYLYLVYVYPIEEIM